MANLVTPFEDPVERSRAGLFGMLIFIVSLAMVFVATILGVVVVRLQDPGPWPPDDGGSLPWVLVAGTAVLLISSGTMIVADAAARRGEAGRLARWMTVTFVLALAFLLLQAVAWWELATEQIRLDSNLWAWTFYVLTALHALHVLGGILPMAVVVVRARRHRYTIEDHRGVTNVGLYWHFLDLAWLGLYATIVWATWFRSGV